MVMYFAYFKLSFEDVVPEIHSFVALIFLSLIAVLVYSEGRERLEVCIDTGGEQNDLN